MENRRRAKRNRYQSASSRLRTNACLVLAALVWSGSLLCLTCYASEPSARCCRLGAVKGFEATASVKPAKQLECAEHSCCKQGESAARSERSSKPSEERQCCLRSSQASIPAVLLQSLDPRTIGSIQPPQRVGIESSPQPSGFTWRAPVADRGSTYLLCRAFLI